MSRHPRILFDGAVYHITSRGNRRSTIYFDDRDYLIWMDTLAETADRCGFLVHAFCLMPNHFHLLVETPKSNLSTGMHYLNGRYAKRHNDRHGLSGHVIQGRYHSVLIERDSQLLEVARYIALNPVRAKLVEHAADWRWSSHRYLCGMAHPPSWMALGWLLGRFGGTTDTERQKAYADFVTAGTGRPNPLAIIRSTVVRDEARQTALVECQLSHPNARAAMAAAHATGLFTREHLASYFGVSIRTVSRAIAQLRHTENAESVSHRGA